MRHLIALYAFLARLFRPSYAVHATPFGRVAGVLAELRRNRSRRVRGYVLADTRPAIPAPRRPIDALPATLRAVPLDYVPVVDPREVAEPAAMVRPAYRAFERAQERAYADRQRLGVAVAMDVATAASAAQVSA